MPDHTSCIDALLQAESDLVAEWIAQDPGYEEHTWDVEDTWLTVGCNAPPGFAWTPLELPSTFCAAPLRLVSEAARSMADRFVRRRVLRRDTYDVPGLGIVSAHVLTDTSSDDWPALRLTVADVSQGTRVLRADRPCTSCYASPDGCGADGCQHGWLVRGGADIPLQRPVDTTRLLEPPDPRWHPWYRS